MSATEERAVFVAALRELADLIEGDESLPVPFYSRAQAGFHATREDGIARQLTWAEKLARLRAFAETVGADVVEHPDGARTVTRKVGPIEYLAHVNAETPSASNGKRVVPAEEDAVLVGGAR